jgi:hypothetical protein
MRMWGGTGRERDREREEILLNICVYMNKILKSSFNFLTTDYPTTTECSTEILHIVMKKKPHFSVAKTTKENLTSLIIRKIASVCRQ